jgi:hypothetical protein
VIHIGTIFLGMALSFLSAATKNIEKAFFQNEADLLFGQLSGRTRINLTLPEPISFSDQVSPEQTYFLFRKIFASYSTFEFYPESEFPLVLEKNHFIFKTRWSFKDNRTNNQFVLRVFFYMADETPAKGGPPSPWNFLPSSAWKIREIRAEVLW